MGKKSVSRSPLSFLKGLSTASRKFVTAVPLTEYLNSGSEAKRPTRIVLFSTLITPRIKPPRMGTLMMRTLRAVPRQAKRRHHQRSSHTRPTQTGQAACRWPLDAPGTPGASSAEHRLHCGQRESQRPYLENRAALVHAVRGTGTVLALSDT